MKIKILADSTCDLPQHLLEKCDITLVPLVVVKDGREYRDGVTITASEVFAHVAAGGELCSTSAVSIGEYSDLFEKYSKAYDAVILINLGSGFSACHQNARLAASEFDNVLAFDSMNLTTGQGLVVLEACRLAKELENLDAIAEALTRFREKVETSFLVNKLDYLVKGGRCSSAAALGANLLNLKPCIELKGGKMSVGKKYRGSYSKCLASYVKERLSGRDDIDTETAFLTYTTVSDECYGAVTQAIAEHGSFAGLHEATAGCTISCHCGPDTLGIIFVRK